MNRSAFRVVVLFVVAAAVVSLVAPVAVVGSAATTTSTPADHQRSADRAIDTSLFLPLQAQPEDEDDEEDDNESDDDDEYATVDDAVDPSEVGEDDEDDGEAETAPGAEAGGNTPGVTGDPAGTSADNETPGDGPSIDVDTDTDIAENETAIDTDTAGNETNESSAGDTDAGESDPEGEENESAVPTGVTGAGDGDAATDDDDDGFGFGMPSPGDWTAGILEWAFEDIMNGIAEFIDRFSMFMTSVPAPGEPTDISSWYSPDDPVWETVWLMYWTMVVLSTPWATVNIMQALSMENPKQRVAMLKENAATILYYPTGPFFIGLFCHTTNIIVGGFTPAGEEFLASPEGLAQLGVGVVMGAIIAKASPIILFIGIAIVVLIAVIIMFSASISPLAMTARSSGWPTARSMGNLVVTSFLLLLILRAMQSFGLRLFFEMPLEELAGDALVVFLFVNAIGLYYLLYRLPKEVIEKTFAASAMMLRVSYMPKDFSAKQALSNAKQGYHKKRRQVSKARNAVGKRLPTRKAASSDGVSANQGTSGRSNGGKRPVTRRTPKASGSNTGTRPSTNVSGPSRQRHMKSGGGSQKPRKRLKRTDSGYTVVDT